MSAERRTIISQLFGGIKIYAVHDSEAASQRRAEQPGSRCGADQGKRGDI